MMGTPERSKVWIWRENSRTSMCSTFCRNSWMPPVPFPAFSVAASAALISTGVTPLPTSWSATAPADAPSMLPCTISPAPLRPR
jgi:hypothetical protein